MSSPPSFLLHLLSIHPPTRDGKNTYTYTHIKFRSAFTKHFKALTDSSQLLGSQLRSSFLSTDFSIQFSILLHHLCVFVYICIYLNLLKTEYSLDQALDLSSKFIGIFFSLRLNTIHVTKLFTGDILNYFRNSHYLWLSASLKIKLLETNEVV